MARRHNDDLFAESTMTFGEHLEELRTALFRALVGIIFGFLIGLMFATYVVEWIKSPLSKALGSYYLESSESGLEQKFQGDVPPEMMALVQEDKLIPEYVKVEPLSLLRKLKDHYPDQFKHIEVSATQFSPADLKPDSSSELCKALFGGSKDKNSTMGRIWALMSEDKRQRVEVIAAKEGQDDRSAVIAILNSVLDDRSLAEGELFEGLKKALPDASTQETVKSLHHQLQQQFTTNESRRLNRLLLSGLFADYLQSPRVNLVEIALWKPVDVTVQTLGVHEGFMIWVKAALISGIVIACPWIFWQIWSFVAAGLYPREKKFVHVFLPFSIALFLAGAALAFFFVFQPVLDFLFSFNRRLGIEAVPRMSEWLSFVLFLPLGFGISFQLPLVMLFLERIGVFTVGAYLSKWRVAVLVIFCLAMLLTPADPISMLLMAVPLTFLYFGGIGLCRWLPKRASPLGEGYDP